MRCEGGTLSAIALLLAAVGVYAVAAFETVSRRHEMAIRLALGASARRLRGWLAIEILWPVLAGTTIGLGAAEIGVRAFRSRIAELASVNLEVICAAALLILVATALAIWRPARNATRVDPAAELRSS